MDDPGLLQRVREQVEKAFDEDITLAARAVFPQVSGGTAPEAAAEHFRLALVQVKSIRETNLRQVELVFGDRK